MISIKVFPGNDRIININISPVNRLDPLLYGYRKCTKDSLDSYSDGRMDVTEDFVIIDNGNPDWTGEWNIILTWKNFHLSFLFDFKLGGSIISGINIRLTDAGLHKLILFDREGEEPLKYIRSDAIGYRFSG